MRVLHTIGSLSAKTGGPTRVAVEMATAVARRGHDVAVYATDYGAPTVPLADARSAGVDIRLFPIQPPASWRRSRPMARALREAVPAADVVHLDSMYLHHCAVTGALCRRSGVPYLIRPHGSLDPYFRHRRRLQKWAFDLLFQKEVLRNAVAIHYTSKLEMDLAGEAALGVPGVVIPLGLHLSDYAALPPRGTFRARHPEIGNRRIVLFLGRLNYKKGLDILIPAVAQAARRHPDLHLVLVGPDDNMAAKVKDWAETHRLADRLTLTGMLTGADKLAALVDSEAFVMPSYSDNFGIAVVEAMACGLPVLVSDKVGVWPEVVADGAGRVAPCETAAFGEALTAMLADHDGLARMRATAPAAVARRYDWTVIAGQLETLYERALSSRRNA